MTRRAFLFAPLTAVALPAQEQGERLREWNKFAGGCNEYLHTVDANSEKRAWQKVRLNDQWVKVYPLL